MQRTIHLAPSRVYSMHTVCLLSRNINKKKTVSDVRCEAIERALACILRGNMGEGY